MDPFEDTQTVRRLLQEWHKAKSEHMEALAMLSREYINGNRKLTKDDIDNAIVHRARDAENRLHRLVDPLWKEPR